MRAASKSVRESSPPANTTALFVRSTGSHLPLSDRSTTPMKKAATPCVAEAEHSTVPAEHTVVTARGPTSDMNVAPEREVEDDEPEALERPRQMANHEESLLSHQDVKPSGNGGSLLRLFQSECFDSHFHMHYLFKRDEQGVHDYLVNLLYKRPAEEIHFYLPQLCQLAMVKYGMSALSRFLLDKAARSMHLALKAHWLFQSAFEDKLPGLSDVACKMREEIEMAVVNSKPSARDALNDPGALDIRDIHLTQPATKTPDLFLRPSPTPERAFQFLAQRFPKSQSIFPAVDASPSSHTQLAAVEITPSPSLQPVEKPTLEETPTVAGGSPAPPHVEVWPPEEAAPVGGALVVPSMTLSSPPPSEHPCSVPSLPTAEELGAAGPSTPEPASAAPMPTRSLLAERARSTKGKIAPGFITHTGSVTIKGSKIKLPSVYAKLQTPFNYTSFSRESHSHLLEDNEMQPFIIKQRRCEYFNLVGSFISMLIEVSDKLATEPDRNLRLPLLINFFVHLNEWILCRRCIVAASEGIFAMTGLLVPFTHFGVEPERAISGVPTPFQAPFLLHPTASVSEPPSHFSSVQIVRICLDSCKVFYSKKRAPFLMVFELADLDEDISQVSSDEIMLPPKKRHEGSSGSDSVRMSESMGSVKREISWDSLHVYTAILQELKHKGLFMPIFCSRGLRPRELERITNPATRDICCPICMPPEDSSGASGSSEVASADLSPDIFPFECPICKGTRLFHEAIRDDMKVTALRRSLGVAPTRGAAGETKSGLNIPPPATESAFSTPPNPGEATNRLPPPDSELKKPLPTMNLKLPGPNSTRKLSYLWPTGLNNSSIRSQSAERRDPRDRAEPIGGRQKLSRRSSSVGPSPRRQAQVADGQTVSVTRSPGIVTSDERGLVPAAAAPPMALPPLKKTGASTNALPSLATILGSAAGLVKPYPSRNLSSTARSSPLSAKPPRLENAPAADDPPPATPSPTPAAAEVLPHPELMRENETPKEQALRIRKILWPETWDELKEKIRQSSPYGHLQSWQLGGVIVKGNDDVRQELLASQLVQQFKAIFDEANLRLWLRPYEILVTGSHSGIMEFVPDTLSIDSIKRKFNVDSVNKVFEAAFADNPYQAKRVGGGTRHNIKSKKFQNFIEAHAAYSLLGYILQVKDRHNGNLLIDARGRIIHIDFGFMLANSPGYVNFETSPFKLSAELMAIMDGEFSDNFEYFKELLIRGFLETRKHSDRILLVVEMMLSASKMPCFAGSPDAALGALKDRFMLGVAEEACIAKVLELVSLSVNNWRTAQYDNFQRLTNGIM